MAQVSRSLGRLVSEARESVTILKRSGGIPLLANIPHSSTFISGSIRDTLVLDSRELQAELLKMTDRYVDELFSCVTELGGITIVYNYSRLVVDPERFEDDAKEMMASKGQGVIYTHTSDGRKLRKHEPSNQERQELLDRYYRPYHEALEIETQRLLDSFGRCLILDCHSFPSRPLPYELNQDSNRPDICLGTDPFHTPMKLLESVEAFFGEHGLTTTRNMPFEGTYVPLKFLGTDKRVSSLMIEVNRKLYMDEETSERSGAFQELVQTMVEMIQFLISRLQQTGDEECSTS